MARQKDQHNPEAVNAHIESLDADLKQLVNAIRQVILGADSLIGEQIKWNSPSFFYTGEMQPFDPKEYKRDIAVLNLSRGKALLVLPTGAKIAQATAVLEGDYKDGRRMVPIKDMADLASKTRGLQAALKEWIALVE